MIEVGRDTLTLTVDAPEAKAKDEETGVKSIIRSLAGLIKPTLSHSDLASPEVQSGMTDQKNVGEDPDNKLIWNEKEKKYLPNPDT